MYRAHCAVIFAIAQLSCFVGVSKTVAYFFGNFIESLVDKSVNEVTVLKFISLFFWYLHLV